MKPEEGGRRPAAPSHSGSHTQGIIAQSADVPEGPALDEAAAAELEAAQQRHRRPRDDADLPEGITREDVDAYELARALRQWYQFRTYQDSRPGWTTPDLTVNTCTSNMRRDIQFTPGYWSTTRQLRRALRHLEYGGD